MGNSVTATMHLALRCVLCVLMSSSVATAMPEVCAAPQQCRCCGLADVTCLGLPRCTSCGAPHQGSGCEMCVCHNNTSTQLAAPAPTCKEYSLPQQPPAATGPLLRAQIISSIQSQPVPASIEHDWAAAFQTHTWKDFAALVTPLQDFSYSAVNVSGIGGITTLLHFDYGLGDNDFGSYHLPASVQPIVVVNDGDLAAACTNVGNQRACGAVPKAQQLIKCLQD